REARGRGGWGGRKGSAAGGGQTGEAGRAEAGGRAANDGGGHGGSQSKSTCLLDPTGAGCGQRRQDCQSAGATAGEWERRCAAGCHAARRCRAARRCHTAWRRVAHTAAPRRPAPSAPRPHPPLSPPADPTPAGKPAPGPGEPYPPMSDGLVNSNGAGKANKHLAPRSPRTALEPDPVEMPPSRRSKRARHPFVVIGNAIITLFVLTAVIAAFGLVLGKQRFDAPGPLVEDRVVNIPRGSGIRDISDVLVRESVIDQPWVFVGGILVLKAREDLKAGEYQFKAHASLRDVVATIIEGRVVAHQLTIPEGLTSEQIVARLLDDDVLTGNIKEIPREGSLLPDTYNFNRGVTREQMIQRMQQAQQPVLKEVWDRRSPDLPIKTPEQLVVLASLVEKETGKPEERTRVAAVFVNRLKQKMRLQSDPTIIYGLVGGK